MLFSYPSIPMGTKNSISFLRSKSFTERVLVDADTFTMGLTKETVEERRSNPGLKNLPATNIGTDDGSSLRYSENA